ncbi:MAG: TVP38/TMEM64 family protein [Desulfobacterales bacterium]|nr:MAG: TVP38/TMEM64 family protein [Desulfobacterales bacterium]UCD89907.1 MAG: TVP38/TMEM64 family protein [Desulfobacterales bacterium]
MSFNSLAEKYKIPIIIAVIVLVLLGYVYRIPLWQNVAYLYDLLTDRDQIKTFVTSFGQYAPIVFIIIQILQVLFAPFPGEATGFIGGFLFGTAKGFVYSSIGLTLGSLINFSVGRFLGKRYVRKLIPAHQLEKLDILVKRQGVIVFFILFLFPGFPKDYLSLLLGLSAIPAKVFIVIAAIGRMPGTLMLSLQGSYVFEQQYGWFAVILGVCLVLIFLAYKYREDLYRWLEK